MATSQYRFNHLIPDLKRTVNVAQLERFKNETCVNGDLDYKLPQLLEAASNDAVKGKVIERAVHVIDQCLLLRDVLQIDSILNDSYFPPDLLEDLTRSSCLSVVGDDKKGNTVIFFNLQKFDPVEYARLWARGHREIPEGFAGHPEFSDACVVNYCSLWYVRMMEWIHQSRFSQYKSGMVEEPKVVMILNIEGMKFSAYSHELKQFLKGIRIIGGYLFPEICDYIFAANVPWVADKFWPIIRMVLHPTTAMKVDLFDKSRTMKLLPQRMPLEQLPDCFGGSYQPETRFKKSEKSPSRNSSPSTSSSMGPNN